MALSALTIIKNFCAEMGLAQPAFVIGSQDNGVVQYLALLNSLGRELQKEFAWTALQTEYRFTTQYVTTTGITTAGSAVVTGIPTTTGLDATYMVTGTGINQDTYVSVVDSGTQATLTQAATSSGTVSLNFCKTKYAMPSDFDRLVDHTEWDKTRHWEMIGPQSPQQWQWLKSGYISTAPRIRWRPMGGYFQVWPALASSEYLGMEYISLNWVRDANGVGKACITADTDTLIYPDFLAILGLKDKFTQAKGLARQYQQDYWDMKSTCKANDLSLGRLSMNARQSNVLIGTENLPDTGFGS